MNQHTFVFLDIDGTLLGLNQLPTVDTLPSMIDRMVLNGFSFGLNSNRALEDVLDVIALFHLTGPFILENGAYALERLGSEPVYIAGLPDRIPETVESAVRSVSAIVFPDFSVLLIDTVRMVRGDFDPQKNCFYLNQFRRFSASIHHRTQGRHSFEIAAQLADVLNQYLKEHHVSLVAEAHRHGDTVTVTVPGITKASGLALARKRYPTARLVAIGDDESDLALRTYVDKLFAVANAVPELKATADWVASQPITAGVVEILDRLFKDGR